MRIEEREISVPDGLLTDKRKLTIQGSPNPELPDHMNILLAGWGHTGKNYQAVGNSYLDAFGGNSMSVSTATFGRGTKGYDAGNIGAYNLTDSLVDASLMARALLRELPIERMLEHGGTLTVSGHSYGGLEAFALINQLLLELEEKTHCPEDLRELTRGKIGIALLGPVNGRKGGMFDGKFIIGTLPKFIESVGLAIKGKKGLELDKEFFQRVMHTDDYAFEQAVPDSANRFLKLLLNPSNRYADVAPELAKLDIPVHILRGSEDKLISAKTTNRIAHVLGKSGIRVEQMSAQGMAHSFPETFNSNEAQIMHEFWLRTQELIEQPR